MAPPLLSLKNAVLTVGGNRLMNGIDVGIGRGERIALVGRNGSGKSTLLKVLAGQVDLDGGERFVQPRTAIAWLPQEPDLTGFATALDYVLGGSSDEMAQYSAEAILERLGMDPGRSTVGLSGGEGRRLSLARTLLGEPQILLLDEPTNHLDLATIEWLEQELEQFRGGLVLISHDRAFLNRLSAVTWWLDRGQLRVNEAGFAAFEAWSTQVLENEEAEAHRLDRRIASELDWVRYGVTGRRKRNMGRLRKLADLRQVRRDLIGKMGQVKLQAESGSGGGTLVVEADAATKGFGGAPIIAGFSTRIVKGDRVGFVGPNGSGKSTLLALLTGEQEPDSGRIRIGTSLTVARYDQQRRSLDPSRTPWETLCPDGGDQVMVMGRYRHVVGYLRDFLFDEAQARTPVKVLSGGERNRLLLARILAQESNLLVLDEPTNDLDMDTLDVLTEVLDDYKGTVLLVSHDRDFLDRIVTSTVVAEGGGRWREYAGGYTDYLMQRAEEAPPAKARSAPVERPRPARRVVVMDAKLERELQRLPARLEKLAAEIAVTEASLADGAFYLRDPAGFAKATGRLGGLRAEVAGLEDRWLELEALRETLEG